MKDSGRKCPFKCGLKNNQRFSKQGTGERSFYREGTAGAKLRSDACVGDENIYLLLHSYMFNYLVEYHH